MRETLTQIETQFQDSNELSFETTWWNSKCKKAREIEKEDGSCEKHKQVQGHWVENEQNYKRSCGINSKWTMFWTDVKTTSKPFLHRTRVTKNRKITPKRNCRVWPSAGATNRGHENENTTTIVNFIEVGAVQVNVQRSVNLETAGRKTMSRVIGAVIGLKVIGGVKTVARARKLNGARNLFRATVPGYPPARWLMSRELCNKENVFLNDSDGASYWLVWGEWCGACNVTKCD